MAENPPLSKRIAQNITYGINSGLNFPVSAWEGMKSAVTGPNPWETPALRSGELYLNSEDRNAAKQAQENAQVAENLKYLDASPQMSMQPEQPSYSSPDFSSFGQYLNSMPEPGMVQPLPAQQPTQEQLNMEAQAPSGVSGVAPMPSMGSKPGKLSTIDMLRQQYQQSISEQKQGISEAEKRLQEYLKKPGKMDLSPLIALAEQWGGGTGNLLRAYKPPEDRKKEVENLQQQVLKARGGLSDTQTRALKDELMMEEKAQDRSIELSKLAQKSQEIAAMQGKKQGDKLIDLDNDAIKNIAKSDEAKRINGITSFMSSLNKYRDLVDSYKLQPIGSKEQKLLQSAYSDVKLKYKEAGNLGALSGPDIGIVIEGIPDATDKMFALSSKLGVGGGYKAILDTIDQVKGMSKKEFDTNMSSLRSGFGQYGGEKLLNNYNDQFSKSFGGSKKWTKEELIQLQQTNPQEFERIVGGK
jgi:hypothetical protein